MENEKNTTTATTETEAKGIAYYNAFMEDYLGTNYGLINPRSFKINCLNPAHADNNPSMSYDKRKKILHCFSCGASYDLIDLVQLEGHAHSCKDAISYLANLYEGKELPPGFNAGELKPGAMKDYRSLIENGIAEQSEEDKALLYNFLATRGFTDKKIAEAVINTYRLFIRSFEESYYFSDDEGTISFYDNKEEASKHPGAKSEKVSLKRLVIPQRSIIEDRLIYNSFNARLIPGTVKAITPGLAEALDSYKKARYRKPREATFLLFDNMQILTLGTGAPITIYITEGELDSISLTASIYEYNLAHPGEKVNAWSIALAGSPTALIINKLKAFTEEQRANFNFIILTDNDTQGETFKEQLEEGLKGLGVFSYAPKLYEALGVKDFNEAYTTTDRAELLEAVIKYASNPRSIAEEETRKQREEERQAYINSKSAFNFLLAFKEDIKTSERLSPTPTGFNNLNNLFKGGIPKGLLTIGALTSLGKTTFILQLADQLAQLGENDILYFTLEMSKEELISKSISRLTFIEAYRKTKSLEDASKLAKNNLSILQGNRYKYYNDDEKALIDRAFNDYSSFAKRIYFIDSVATGGIDINEIEKIILEHIEKTGKKPIVFLDYLQIIKSPDFHLSDKQATDFNISALKRISAKNSLLIIAISSLNRASYSEKVDLNSFKESGAVEYTNDILIGLNFSKLYEIEEEQTTEEGKKHLKEQGLLTKSEEINQNKLKALIKKEKKARPRKITLEVLKNRNGETGGTISFYYYPGANTYLELIPPTGADEDFIKEGKSIFSDDASLKADIETPLKLIDSSINRDYQENFFNDDLPF